MEESKVFISFDYADNGFYNFNGPLKDFEIAGEDEIFYEAKAKFMGSQLLLNHFMFQTQEKSVMVGKLF